MLANEAVCSGYGSLPTIALFSRKRPEAGRGGAARAVVNLGSVCAIAVAIGLLGMACSETNGDGVAEEAGPEWEQLRNRGRALYVKERYDEAIEVFEQALAKARADADHGRMACSRCPKALATVSRTRCPGPERPTIQAARCSPRHATRCWPYA